MSSSLVRHDPALPQGRAALQKALEAGSAVVLPTDTVPGLAVLAGNPKALERLRALKKAPPEKPFSLHPRDKGELRRLLPALPPGLPGWMDRRLPGPWTVVLPRDWVALPRAWEWPWPAVGLRLSRHAALRKLAASLPAPLLLTSINPHGAPPLHGAALAAWLEAHPEVIVGLDPTREKAAAPSTVVAFDPLPRVIRGSAPPEEMHPGLRVLVVCSGNICRSPLAAALLRSELAAAWGVAPEKLSALGWEIASAGTFALPGAPASDHSIRVAAERGLKLGQHRAWNLGDALRQPWDRVLAMGNGHLRALPRDQTAELFAPSGKEIPDPFGGDLKTYRQTGRLIEEAVKERIAVWSRWPDPA